MVHLGRFEVSKSLPRLVSRASLEGHIRLHAYMSLALGLLSAHFRVFWTSENLAIALTSRRILLGVADPFGQDPNQAVHLGYQSAYTPFRYAHTPVRYAHTPVRRAHTPRLGVLPALSASAGRLPFLNQTHALLNSIAFDIYN